jgi:hypothetical protein
MVKRLKRVAHTYMLMLLRIHVLVCSIKYKRHQHSLFFINMYLDFTYSYIFFGLGRLYSLLGSTKFLIFLDGFANGFSSKVLRFKGYNCGIFLSKFFSLILKKVNCMRFLNSGVFILFENDINKIFSAYLMDFLCKHSLNLVAVSMNLVFFNLIFFDPHNL